MQNFHILKYGWQTKTTGHLKFGDKYGKNISYTATKTALCFKLRDWFVRS